jgi:hypothetical protein
MIPERCKVCYLVVFGCAVVLLIHLYLLCIENNGGVGW